MDELRYWIACALLVGLPPGLLFWLCIHPFAGFWRKRGAGLDLRSGGGRAEPAGREPVCGPQRAAGHRVRDGRRVSGAGWGVSGRCWCARLPAPETPDPAHSGRAARNQSPAPSTPPATGGDLCPHPTPTLCGSVCLSLLGFALVANYLLVYVWTALSLPLLSLIVGFEERELHRRFGPAYAEYCRRVPRFVPRRRAERAGG